MATTTLTPTSATAETPKLVKPAPPSDAKTPVTPTQTTFGCQHIKGLLTAARQQATDGYTRLIQSLRKEEGMSDRTHTSSNGAKTITSTTYLCLQCPTVSSTRDRHRKDHVFAVESDNGFIYCHDCRDFVYDPTFEALRTTTTSSKKRKLSALATSTEDRKFVRNNTSTTPCAATGLRGIYNMGQTCFMSVVLQCLIHNPLVRSWYLSEGHKSSDCEREACTACALDDIFTDFYGSEKHEGYGAVHMLQGCWKGGGNLAGYSQQDAHEYLGFILNSLHTAITEEDDPENGSSKKKRDTTKDCPCPIHQTFSGQLRSTVTCTTCRNTTTAYDPFMDLSLDIRSTTISVKKKKLTMINGTTTVKEVLPMDLKECLDRFTSAEMLSGDSYHCRKCESNQDARKKLSLSRLPPILPIHLKRFSHSKVSAQSTKVETRIRLPLVLDLSPYLSSPGPRSKSSKPDSQTNGHKPDDDLVLENPDEENTSSSSSIAPAEPVYELSSVIVHKGKIDNGHYISYNRQGLDGWFRFDDSMVVQVEEREVLGCEAYMVVYVAKGF
ncbi:hypothetical protein LTR27_004145 [Elasticomyces elasticus]|nr:hypothetical protein LTR27_004145 [Elasticomyces elasticus]